jgi:hypothetical protein
MELAHETHVSEPAVLDNSHYDWPIPTSAAGHFSELPVEMTGGHAGGARRPGGAFRVNLKFVDSSGGLRARDSVAAAPAASLSLRLNCQ